MSRILVLLFLAMSLLISCASTGTAPATPGVRVPTIVTRVDPEYPAELKAAGVQGVVEISGTVPKEGGMLRNPRVVHSDDPRLAPLALSAVSRWIWTPGMQDGKEVDVEFTTTVRFSSHR